MKIEFSHLPWVNFEARLPVKCVPAPQFEVPVDVQESVALDWSLFETSGSSKLWSNYMSAESVKRKEDADLSERLKQKIAAEHKESERLAAEKAKELMAEETKPLPEAVSDAKLGDSVPSTSGLGFSVGPVKSAAEGGGLFSTGTSSAAKPFELKPPSTPSKPSAKPLQPSKANGGMVSAKDTSHVSMGSSGNAFCDWLRGLQGKLNEAKEGSIKINRAKSMNLWMDCSNRVAGLACNLESIKSCAESIVSNIGKSVSSLGSASSLGSVSLNATEPNWLAVVVGSRAATQVVSIGSRTESNHLYAYIYVLKLVASRFQKSPSSVNIRDHDAASVREGLMVGFLGSMSETLGGFSTGLIATKEAEVAFRSILVLSIVFRDESLFWQTVITSVLPAAYSGFALNARARVMCIYAFLSSGAFDFIRVFGRVGRAIVEKLVIKQVGIYKTLMDTKQPVSDNAASTMQAAAPSDDDQFACLLLRRCVSLLDSRAYLKHPPESMTHLPLKESNIDASA